AAGSGAVERPPRRGPRGSPVRAQAPVAPRRYGLGDERPGDLANWECVMENVTLMQLVDDVRACPPTVSEVFAQAIKEWDSADASVPSLARIRAGAQALAAMVLKLATSAYYGYARKIESLPDAVVLLGFASVKTLAITASITRLL